MYTLRMIIPIFRDFCFDVHKDTDKLYLKWFSSFSEKAILARSASDGSIRFFTLVTILSMPLELRPSLVLLEEPEIGLHPFDLEILSDLITTYAEDNQIILTTQSPLLLNKAKVQTFHVFNMNKETGETHISTLDKTLYEEWLQHYSIAELWKMNIIGGTPL